MAELLLRPVTFLFSLCLFWLCVLYCMIHSVTLPCLIAPRPPVLPSCPKGVCIYTVYTPHTHLYSLEIMDERGSRTRSEWNVKWNDQLCRFWDLGVNRTVLYVPVLMSLPENRWVKTVLTEMTAGVLSVKLKEDVRKRLWPTAAVGYFFLIPCASQNTRTQSVLQQEIHCVLQWKYCSTAEFSWLYRCLGYRFKTHLLEVFCKEVRVRAESHLTDS